MNSTGPSAENRWTSSGSHRSPSAARIADIESPEQRAGELFQAVLLRQPNPSELEEALQFVAAAEAVREEPPSPTRKDWDYGYGEVDEGQGRTGGFTPLPHFSGQAWQGGPDYPDRELGWVKLSATGGHPGNDRAHAAVRRWTAPRAMEIQIDSTLSHEPPQGDGVRAFIVSSRETPGILAQAHVHRQTRQLDLQPRRVVAGETVDFLVDIGDGLSHDQYRWPVRIVGTTPDELPDDGVSKRRLSEVGEIGRTPTVELGGNGKNKQGRDHNHYGFSVWMAGGGIKGGTAYGATDEFGFQAVENPVSIHDLHATMLHLLGFDHTRLTYRYAGRDFRLTDVHGQVIDAIVG